MDETPIQPEPTTHAEDARAAGVEWRHVWVWSLLVAVALGAVALGNAIVDPFGEYRIGAPSLESYRSGRSRSAKANLAASASPSAVVIGSSRAEAGYRPDHPGFGSGVALNLGLQATNMWESARVIDALLDQDPPDRIVLCLDFLMFGGARRSSDDFMQSGFNPDLHPITTELETLVSLRASKASARVVLGLVRGRPSGSSMTDGFNTRTAEQITGSQRELFEAVLTHFATNPQTYGGYVLADDRFNLLRGVLDRCRDAGVRVDVVINPIHASQIDLIERLGLWDAFETFKRRVVATVSEATGDPVYDAAFAGEAQSEPIPAAGDDSTRMRWYFESSHFQPALGDRVLSAVLQDEPGAGPGAFVGPLGVDAHLERCRRLLDEWRRARPSDASLVAGVVGSL